MANLDGNEGQIQLQCFNFIKLTVPPVFVLSTSVSSLGHFSLVTAHTIFLHLSLENTLLLLIHSDFYIPIFVCLCVCLCMCHALVWWSDDNLQKSFSPSTTWVSASDPGWWAQQWRGRQQLYLLSCLFDPRLFYLDNINSIIKFPYEFCKTE